ncbi:hypothetical protein EDB85DRAFT_2095013 [Lactarius pseudohatsudake]|nr:hypothetical protein EDB85DRAFT_2095013 [Lactarius pseudohatsudake]
MAGKRPRPDSAGLFLSRKSASDIANGDIDAPGSYIVGRIFSKNPAKNQYTVDIRRDSNAKAAYLDVVIEDKLQKRLELLVGDQLHILLKGAQLLPHSGPASHLPALLRFREGITILLVSRAGLQGEKEKLFNVWPGSNINKAKKRRHALDAGTPDTNWFSTPPPGDTNLDAMGSAPSSQAAIPASGNSSLPPSDPSSSFTPPSPTYAGHPPATNNAESSTAGAALPTRRQSTPRVKNRSAATYAYRTTPSHEELAPIDLTSPPESPTATGSATIAHSILGEAPPDVCRTASALPSRNSSDPHNGDGGTVLRCPQPGKQKSGRRKKRDEKKLSSATAKSPSPTEIVPAALAVVKTEEVHKDLCRSNDSRTELDAVLAREDTPPELVTNAQSGSKDAKELSGDDPDLSMRAGLIVNGWAYTALSQVRDKAKMSVIGVVSSVGKEPTRATTGDWCICFSLLDPSVLDSFGGVLYTDGVGMKLNCFMRLEKWLPNPKRGDVVLLRQVKIGQWQDKFTGTCYSNTMQWAIYDPAAEKVLQPDPELSNIRFHNPPVWNVVPLEIEYCAQLVKWWAAVQRTRAERQGTAVQIGGGPITAGERKTVSRQHLLIRDADPGRDPRGYFNCTVEVLHGHANHVSDIHSIYVTDYTSKSGTFAEHSSEWCPVSLADRVLRIEMWRGEAVALAQQMKPGDYWSLDNVRMKVSNGGYIEGSFSEAAKARKLSVTDVDTNHHLQALLQRKKAWEENDANPHVFPHKLLNEVELQSIFDCTVEVIHAEYNATGTSLLYITDYTERSDLATPPTALWSRELQGRIVTLELQGPQSKMADKVDIGAFFNVKHMRLIERVMGVGRVVGRIGGPDRLIHKLNANNPNEELEQLFRRRKRWEEEKAAVTKRTESFTTIARILKNSNPADKFQVRARVVGTFPLQLKDCVVRCCKGCSERVPESMDVCMTCTAPEGESPGWESMFHLFLRLQDERGNAQITVSVDHNSSILRGLSPDDVAGGTAIVRKRLADYIGNLEAVQAANSLKRTLAASVPVREFTIESWQVEDDVIAYGLA